MLPPSDSPNDLLPTPNQAIPADAAARDRLFTTIQSELRDIARRKMSGQRTSHTLQPTALVNEAYLRLQSRPELFGIPPDQFIRVAAKVMQNLLVSHARHKHTKKRQAPGERVPLDDVVDSFTERALDILALNEALDQLASTDPIGAAFVQLRFFGGQSMAECGRILGIPETTMSRRWEALRAKLRFMIEAGSAEPRGNQVP
jgi:RNA polymerase sigma-70 factor (ECF subfamily)